MRWRCAGEAPGRGCGKGGGAREYSGMTSHCIAQLCCVCLATSYPLRTRRSLICKAAYSTANWLLLKALVPHGYGTPDRCRKTRAKSGPGTLLLPSAATQHSSFASKPC